MKRVDTMRSWLMKYKYIVKMYECIFGPIHWLVYMMKHTKWPSLKRTHFSYGKLNKNKKFYVIKYNRPECGIFSMIFHLIPQIEYAARRKYVPIIDCRETFLPMIQDEKNVGKENAWEYYFEQPMENYSLDEVYHSKHVIYVRKNGWGIKKSLSYNDIPLSAENLDYWSGIFNKYLKPNTKLRERIELERKLFPDDNRILGISIRAEYRWGGITKRSLYYQHPKIMDCETFISEIERVLEEWKYEQFFLACDDREYSDKVAAYFGKKCIRMDRPLPRLFENGMPLPEEEMQKEFADYTVQRKTEDYIAETYLLSQCDSLYTCIGSGVQFAYIINGGKYRYLEIYNGGLWSKEDLQK